MDATRTPVTLVSGLDAAAVGRTARSLVVAGTTLVQHDLTRLRDGVIVRTVRAVDLDGVEQVAVTDMQLVHGCVGCTLREDLLPLLRQLHRRAHVDAIVVALDPTMEPEAVSFAIDSVIVSGMPGFVDAPAGHDVAITATVTCVNEAEWFAAATGDAPLSEEFEAAVDDERTVAQVAVGQVAFADALVVAACDPFYRDAWESARLMAVLRRLAPSAPMIMEMPQRKITPLLASRLLASVGPTARRGRIDDPHGPLLRGMPPLESDCGVAIVEFHSDRPFHPERLHEAIDVLLEGVVSARGRMWLATQPDESLWLESAGGGLRVAEGGPWLASMTEQERGAESADRLAMAALRWDDTFGDRHSSMAILVHDADPVEVQSALRAACLTDAEMDLGQAIWMAMPDPFGTFHVDPCDDDETSTPLSNAQNRADNRPEQP